MRFKIYDRFFHRILRINDTPEAVALGAALGLFLAMTPTVGIQMVLIVIICTLVRANRLAGLVMVYVSNPFTLIPIYWLDYVLGSTLLGLGHVSRERFEVVLHDVVQHGRSLELWKALEVLVVSNKTILLPTLIGGVALGGLLAIPVYPLTLRAMRIQQRRRAHKQALLKLREIRRREREEEAKRQAHATHPERKVS